MKLGLDFIAECLKEQGFDIHTCEISSGSENSYELPALYCDNQKLDDQCLYIVRADRLPENPYMGRDVALIIIGEPSEAYSSQRCSLLLMEENENLLYLYAAVVGIFRKYDGWLNALDNLFEKNAALQSYLDVTHSIVNNTISVHDSFANPLAIVPEKTPDGKNFLQEIANVDPKWIAENAQTDITQKKAYITTYDYQGRVSQTLICNLFDEEAFLGQINISDSFSPIRTIDYWIIEMLAEKIKKTFIENQSIKQQQIKSFRSTFAELLAGTYVDPERLERRAERIGYAKSDQYLVVSVKILRNSSRQLPLSIISQQIQRQIMGITSLQYESELALLVNLTFSNSRPDDIIWKLSGYLPSGKYQVGISNAFTDLSDTNLYYKEACLAIEYGSREEAGSGIYQFKDYMQEHLLHYGTSLLPIKLLCLKEVLELHEMDRKASYSLCETLRVCFKNHMNVTRSAEDMHIHRSTLLYRLDRIRQVLDIDTNNYSRLLYIQISLELCRELDTLGE